MRIQLSATAGPIGTLPPLVGRRSKPPRGAKDPAVFLDLLGQRLAFERSGSRLYEALVRKLEVAPDPPPGMTRGELEHIRDEERGHAGLLARAIEALGGDPTAVTPAADVACTMSSGLVQVVNDPRTTLLQALDAILAAELVDNAGWVVLSELAHRVGHGRLASLCEQAREQEDEHLEKVRGWFTRTVHGETGKPARSRDPSDRAAGPPAD
jgi:rubrerythrin